MFGIVFMRLLPALIAASIAEKRGYFPVVGIGFGLLLSWPGLLAFVVIRILAPWFDAHGRLRTPKRATAQERPRRRRSEERRAASVAEYAAKKEAERKAALLRQREADLAARDIELEQVRDELADANARAETAENAARQLVREADRKAAMEEADRFWAEADRESASDPLRDVFTHGMPRTRFTDGDAPAARDGAPASKPGARKTSAAGEEG